MEIIGKSYKFGHWQTARIIDNFGTKKIQLKYFSHTKEGKLNWFRPQVIYVLLKDWEELKKEIKKTKKKE